MIFMDAFNYNMIGNIPEFYKRTVENVESVL